MFKLLLFALLICVCNAYSQPTLSITFDDGVTDDMPGYTFEQWNEMLLTHLDISKLKAIFFVTGKNKVDAKGQFLLKSWNDRGHRLSNHTYSHINYGNKNITFEKFKEEFLRTDSIINSYSNFLPLFRFPYLKEGDTKDKIEMARALFAEHNYKNGHVTIDASDWYVDSRLRTRLKQNPKSNLEGFRKFYLEHLYDRAMYYDELGYKLTGRHIHHTLLLHHNLAASLFLGDLIKMFKDKGWKIIDADKAFQDEIFNSSPSIVPAGESLLWALAKESGEYESILRYPAEDGDYEKDKMDRAGL